MQQEITLQFLVPCVRPSLQQQNIGDVFKIPVHLRRRILGFLPVCHHDHTWFRNHQGLLNLELLDLHNNQIVDVQPLELFFKNTWVRLDDNPVQVQGVVPQSNKNAVLSVVAKDGNALEYASDKFKNDKEVVMAGVAQNQEALQYASEALKNDKEVMMIAVKQNYEALQYASEELKNDKEVMMAAVAQKWSALACASEELKNDKEIVLAAVAQNGDALK